MILGAGGFALEAYEYLASDGFSVSGYLSPEEDHTLSEYIKWLGNDDNGFDPNYKYVLGTGLVELRRKIINKFLKKKATFFSFIHSKSYVSKLATLGRGAFIAPNVSIVGNPRIGDFFFANVNSSVGHHSLIKDNVVLSPGSRVSGFCIIENNVSLATNSALVPKTKIGCNSEIGICTYPKRNVINDTIVFTHPGKSILKK